MVRTTLPGVVPEIRQNRRKSSHLTTIVPTAQQALRCGGWWRKRAGPARGADLAHKPPVLWVHGADDKIVADTSFVDINYLGQLGAIPGWLGKETAPPQPMKQQTRAVLDAYARAGGSFTEVEFSDCGHSPHLEYPDTFLDALGAHVGIKARISS